MLVPWKESFAKPWQRIKRQRYRFANKGPDSQSYDFSNSHVQMWELDHKVWALKNWCFWFVVLEKTLEIPWRAGRSNKSILKEVNPGYSSEGLTLKLKLQYFDQLLQKPIHWKILRSWGRLKANEEEGRRGWDSSIASLTQWTWIWANSGR